MNLREIFALNLRQLRHARGWSQEELADRVRVSREYVSQLESAKKSASITVIERAAKALAVEPYQLLMHQRALRPRAYGTKLPRQSVALVCVADFPSS